MRIVTVLGTRPQLIKAAAVSREITECKRSEEVIVHTGQHFDKNMSAVFLEELKIPKPDYFLDINNLSHGAMTGRMIEKIENVLMKEKPDVVLVYGDTNSTLAGALAAKKLHIKIAHIEAGLRSFNMKMPEEVNRVLTDRISDVLFCPTDIAVKNLKDEGFENFKCRIIKSGDVMWDMAYFYDTFAEKPDFNIDRDFILATVHRAENTENIKRLKSIFEGLNKISKEINIILPLHPRTKKILKENSVKVGFELVEPVGYLKMISLIKHCRLVITDSGGLQKESFFFKKPCVVLRDETEWLELLQYGFNVLTGSGREKIYESYKSMINRSFNFDINLYGNGHSASLIVKELLQ